jgi:rod shape determining protein RodA
MSYSKNPAISKGVDWLLVWLYLALVIIGLISIFSVEYRSSDNLVQSLLGFKTSYSKQMFFFGACCVLATFILLTDSKLFTATANLSYVVGIVLILATFVLGKEIKGSRSWIPLGFMNLQAVEVCKIFASLALAKYLSMADTDFTKPRSQMIAAAICFTPAVFSVLQGETGLALVYLSFLIPMYREGLPPGYLVAGIGIAVLLVLCLLVPRQQLVIAFSVIALVTGWVLRRQIRRNNTIVLLIAGCWLLVSSFVWFGVPFVFKKVLKPYQANRIFSMVGVDNPFADKNTAQLLSPEEEKERKKKNEQQDYNVKQSKIAIGSGGFAGKGFLKGTQTQGDFVPEQNTDFIFTAVGENFGFWGTTSLMLIYLGLLLRIVFVAERQRSTFSRVYAYCVAGIFFFHISVNICVTIGLAPVIGITLPLISYGGSSLLTFTILFFILIKLDADRQMVLR